MPLCRLTEYAIKHDGQLSKYKLAEDNKPYCGALDTFDDQRFNKSGKRLVFTKNINIKNKN